MNHWIKLSIEYANQKSYLDDLFQVYPTTPNGIRIIEKHIWKNIEIAFNKKNNKELIKELLKLKTFPIKDSYISFLRTDLGSLDRNPQTINRLAGIFYEMGLPEIYKKCSKPKESNTQIGPMFKNWIDKKSLGILPVTEVEFLSTRKNAILKGGDKVLNLFAKKHFGYPKNKGLDFLCKFNGKYILGETKFITAIGGNQNNSFTDIISTLTARVRGATCIGILDGIPWLKNKSRYYNEIITKFKNYNIMSSLILREFLFQI